MITPLGLRTIFNNVASASRNTLLSDIVMMPLNLQSTGPLEEAFSKTYNFNQTFIYNKDAFAFGFLQVENGGGTATVPTFSISGMQLRDIGHLQPEDLMAPLKEVMTFANHDMWHHYTALHLNNTNGEVAHKFHQLHKDQMPMTKWADKLVERNANASGVYEHWAHRVHQAILLETGDDAAEKITPHLNKFLDALTRIRRSLYDECTSVAAARETVDYFGTVMAHILSRVYPQPRISAGTSRHA